MLIRSWRFVTILLVALLLGLSFAHVLELPAKMQYDAALYVTLQKTLYVAWGPPNVGGILEPAAILATVSLAFLLRQRRPAFWLTLGAGVALLLAFPVVFLYSLHQRMKRFSPLRLPPFLPTGWSCAQTGRQATQSVSCFSWSRWVCSLSRFCLKSGRTHPIQLRSGSPAAEPRRTEALALIKFRS